MVLPFVGRGGSAGVAGRRRRVVRLQRALRTSVLSVCSVVSPGTPPPATLGFGTPRDVFNPRQLQFGVKVKF